MYRFTNLTDLNLTKNEISYIEDGAFAGQANLQVWKQYFYVINSNAQICKVVLIFFFGFAQFTL